MNQCTHSLKSMNNIIIQMYMYYNWQKDDVQCILYLVFYASNICADFFILYSTHQSLFILVYLIKFLLTSYIFMPMRISNNCLNLSEPFTRGFHSLSAPSALITTVWTVDFDKLNLWALSLTTYIIDKQGVVCDVLWRCIAQFHVSVNYHIFAD